MPPNMIVKRDPLNQVGDHLIIQIGVMMKKAKTIRLGSPTAKPIPQKPQPSTSSDTHSNETLRKLKTYPKALTFGRGNMAPLANGFTMGCGHRHECGFDINYPPQPGAPKVVIMSADRIVTTDRVQTYDEMPALVRPCHALVNWTLVRLENDLNAHKGKDEETGQESQIMMIANSKTIDVTSQDLESTDDDLVY